MVCVYPRVQVYVHSVWRLPLKDRSLLEVRHSNGVMQVSPKCGRRRLRGEEQCKRRDTTGVEVEWCETGSVVVHTRERKTGIG